MKAGYPEWGAEEVALKHYYILLNPEPWAEMADWERDELDQLEAEYQKMMRGQREIDERYEKERLMDEIEERLAGGDSQSKVECWGSSDRCCAQIKSKDGRTISPIERDIGRRLEKRFPNLRERVERAFRESNTQLREALRTETGLRLSNDKIRQNVPVRVIDGIPAPLLNKLLDDTEILDLYLDLAMFKDTMSGLEKTLPMYMFLEKWPPMTSCLAKKDELENSLSTLKKIVFELEKLNPFEAIWQIKEDVLGSYFFYQGRIELYWMPIGLMAAGLEVTPEALTQVVAAHELAHAYTHLGFDIDNQTWDTQNFATSSLDVVEGTAQFFTEAVCSRLMNRWPDTYDAYLSLLEKQAGPYRAHLDWVPKDEAGGEAVRLALIMFRAQGDPKKGDFKSMVTQYKELLGRREKPPAEIEMPKELFR